MTLLVVASVIIGLLISKLDAITHEAVERGGTYALGTQCAVDDVKIKLLAGDVRLSGFSVANPTGYTAPNALAVRSFAVSVVPTSVFSDSVRVPKIAVDGLDLHIEQREGTNNLSVIAEHLQKVRGPGEPAPPDQPQPDEAPGGPKMRVDMVVITDLNAHVQMLPVGGQMSTVHVNVPRLVLDDVTPENAAGLAVAELMKRIVPAIIAAIVEKGGNVLPTELAKQLTGNAVVMAQQVGGKAVDLVHQVGGGVSDVLDQVVGGDIGKDLGEGLKGVGGDVGKGVGEGIKGVGDAIGDILGGKKSKTAPSTGGDPGGSGDPATSADPGSADATNKTDAPQSGDTADDSIEALGDGVKSIGDEVGKGINNIADGIGKGFGGILGGDKPKKQ